MWWARLLNVISGLLSGGAAAGGGTSYESIQTYTVGAGGVSSVTFSSIPSTYKHLQIRALGKSTVAGDYDYIFMNVGNGSIDSGSNYAWHALTGNGATASATGAASQTGMRVGYIVPGGVNQASTFAGLVVDLLDYQNTSKYKTVRSLAGFDDNNYPAPANGKGNATLVSGVWLNTAAVNTIQFYTPNNIAQYSSFALYGIKG